MASPARSASISRGSTRCWRSTAPAAPRASRAASSARPSRPRLKPHGLTLRHFPQSFEFSTLGGWIATRSGGHFATLYTHIDDFVESLRVVTPAGVLESRRLPGSGAGPSPDRLMIGSEGALGVITEAWMRLQDRPRFRAGAAARLRRPRGRRARGSRRRPGGTVPVEPAPGRRRRNAPQTASTTAASRCSCSRSNPPTTRSTPGRRARSSWCRTMAAGRWPMPRAAEAWRTAFIRMPYQREVLVPPGSDRRYLRDRDHLGPLRGVPRCGQVGDRAGDPSKPPGTAGLVTCRFTHVYPDGPAPYFSFHARGRAGALLGPWRQIKRAGSDAVIDGGGTITHHHAVGRDHMPWYQHQRPALFGAALAAAKARARPGRHPQSRGADNGVGRPRGWRRSRSRSHGADANR